MTNAQLNARFLAIIDPATRKAILGNIAKHYGITPAEVFAEVTADEAEHLLDYVTGPMREAASVIMQMHGCYAT